MYIVASQWKFGSPQLAQIAQDRFREGFCAVIGAQTGLCFWYLVPTGPDEAMTIAGWASQDDHALAQPTLAAWGQEHLAGLDARVQQRRRGQTTAEAGPGAASYPPGGEDIS